MRWALPIIAAAAMFGLSLLGGPGMRASQPLRGGDPMLSLALPRLPHLASAAIPASAAGCTVASARTEAWNATRIWLGSLQGWSDSPAVLAWREFVHRTKHGTPLPRPAAAEACTQAGLPLPAAG